MLSAEKKILNRAHKIIEKFPQDDNIYYRELVKSYNEYINLNNYDATTKELYLEHILHLCDFQYQKRYSTLIISVMIFIFLIMLSLTIYSTHRYYKLSNNLKDNIIKANANTSVVINYNNSENLGTLLSIDSSEYLSIPPLDIKITSKTQETSSYRIHYDIYLEDVSKKTNFDKTEIFQELSYNIINSSKDNGIKKINRNIIDNNRVLLYSAEMLNDTSDNIELRMWIDKSNKFNYQLNTYQFKIYVDAYIVR